MKKLVCNVDGIWEFFIKDNQVMCYNPLKELHEKVAECDFEDFDASVCENGIIYVITQKNNNFYITRFNGQWETECILESNKESSYPKKLTLISNNNWLNAFYVLEHEGKQLLIHHILGSKVTPEVITNSIEDICFSVTKDEKRNLHIAYFSDENICMRKYIWKNKAWSYEEKLCEGVESVLSISLETAEEFKPLFAYCSKENNSYKVSINNETIASGLQKEVSVCIIKNMPNYSCVFEYYGKILVSYLTDGKWQKVKYLHCDGFQKQESIKISGTKDFEENGSNFFYSYGAKNGGDYRMVCSDSLSLKKYLNKLKNTENEDSVEKFAKIEKKETKDISEEIRSIKRAMEKDDTAQILTEIVSRLSNVESVLEKVVKIVFEINKQFNSEK